MDFYPPAVAVIAAICQNQIQLLPVTVVKFWPVGMRTVTPPKGGRRLAVTVTSES